MVQKDLGTLLPSYTTERISACCASAGILKNSNHSQTSSYKEEICYDESSETLAQVAQRSFGPPYPWKHSRPGRTGLWTTWLSERCPCCLQSIWNYMTFKSPFQPISFYDSRIWVASNSWLAADPTTPSLAPVTWDQAVHWKMRQLLCFLLLEERKGKFNSPIFIL